jgi:hypothetical protein
MVTSFGCGPARGGPMKKLSIAVTIAAALGAAGIARAQTSYSLFSFTVVDAVRMDPELLVTGVLDGAGAATEERIRSGTTGLDLAECRRFALIAMSKPGQYQFAVYAARVTLTGGSSYLYTRDCRLVRATP